MEKLILLVEDNEQILNGNERMLKRSGYDVVSAMTIEGARNAFLDRKPDVIVLDIMLPDGSGLDFMNEIRQSSDIPILLLTGLTTPEDVVRGLSEGGDDYLSKPYDFSVLLARIQALLRRAEQIPQILKKGSLEFDILSNRAFLDAEDMLLTKKEFALLLLMAKNEGRTLSDEYIYETVWKQPIGRDKNAVKTVVSRLRKKLKGQYSIQYDAYDSGYVLTL